jgi:hypothetical protein
MEVYWWLGFTFELNCSVKFEKCELWKRGWITKKIIWASFSTDYRYKCVSKQVTVGTEQYLKWIEGQPQPQPKKMMIWWLLNFQPKGGSQRSGSPSRRRTVNHDGNRNTTRDTNSSAARAPASQARSAVGFIGAGDLIEAGRAVAVNYLQAAATNVSNTWASIVRSTRYWQFYATYIIHITICWQKESDSFGYLWCPLRT